MDEKERKLIYSKSLDSSLRACKDNMRGIVNILRAYANNPQEVADHAESMATIPLRVAASMAVIVMQFVEQAEAVEVGKK